MKLAGVVGYPIGHSLSPKLHGYWLREAGIEGAYIPLSVLPERFSSVLDALRHAGFAGLNVTVPYKEAALALADTVDDAAGRSGASNLLIFRENTVEARNTDVEALLVSLEEEIEIWDLRNKSVVLLGAGGAARAALLALDQLGAGEIRLLNRNPERAEKLAAQLQPMSACRLIPVAWQQWPDAARDAALLVNATSAGMLNWEPLGLSLGELPAEAAVYDLVYNPLETDLLKQARAAGHKTANGLGMLMRQAIPAFEAFYGQTPQITAELCEILRRALAR